MKKSIFCIVLFLIIQFFLIPAGHANAQNLEMEQVILTPLKLIISISTQTLDILGSLSPKQECGVRLKQILEENFDFEEMSRRALGPNWKSASSDQRSRFIALFKERVFISFSARVEKYPDAKMNYRKEILDGDCARVQAWAIVPNETIEIEYRLKQAKGCWKVVDILVEGRSLLENYRNQFTAILVNKSFEDFLTNDLS